MSTLKKKIFRFILPPIYFTRLWIDFIFPNSDPHWAWRNLIFYVLCVGVNILCKHVQMCVCGCVLRHVRGHGKWDGQHEIGVITSHREIMRCDWSPMSTSFIILIKICIKTRSCTIDGFGDLIMRGEGVRHPTISVHKWLPPSMCSCMCLINQAKMLN